MVHHALHYSLLEEQHLILQCCTAHQGPARSEPSFFLAAGYPVLFMLGSEGFFGKLSPWASVLGHCIVDVLSKNESLHCPSACSWGATHATDYVATRDLMCVLYV